MKLAFVLFATCASVSGFGSFSKDAHEEVHEAEDPCACIGSHGVEDSEYHNDKYPLVNEYGSSCKAWDSMRGTPWGDWCNPSPAMLFAEQTCAPRMAGTPGGKMDTVFNDYCDKAEDPNYFHVPNTCQRHNNWCRGEWCYVSPECPSAKKSDVFEGVEVHFSYRACGSPDCYSDPNQQECQFGCSDAEAEAANRGLQCNADKLEAALEDKEGREDVTVEVDATAEDVEAQKEHKEEADEAQSEFSGYTKADGCVDNSQASLAMFGAPCEILKCDGSQFNAVCPVENATRCQTGEVTLENRPSPPIGHLIQFWCPNHCGTCDRFCKDDPDALAVLGQFFGMAPTCAAAHTVGLTCDAAYRMACTEFAGFECKNDVIAPAPKPEECEVCEDLAEYADKCEDHPGFVDVYTNEAGEVTAKYFCKDWAGDCEAQNLITECADPPPAGDDGIPCEVGGSGPDFYGYYYSAKKMASIRAHCSSSCKSNGCGGRRLAAKAPAAIKKLGRFVMKNFQAQPAQPAPPAY